MTAYIYYQGNVGNRTLHRVTQFTASKRDSFPFWTFWAVNEEDPKKVDIHFVSTDNLVHIGIIGGEKL